MVKSRLRGLINRQINRGDSLRATIEKRFNINEIGHYEQSYAEWNQENVRILSKSFAYSYRRLLDSYNSVVYLGNINLDKSTVEYRREKLRIEIGGKIGKLNSVNAQLESIEDIYIFPLPEEEGAAPDVPIVAPSPVESDKATMPSTASSDEPINSSTHFDYAIITALEEHEMEKMLLFIVVEGIIPNSKHLIEYGYLKTNPSKKIVFSSQHSTGMVDASILATEMVIRHTPKFLIMAGVSGGKPKDVEIGDVIVATKVFTIDKGKIDEAGFHREPESRDVIHSCITKFKREKNKIVDHIASLDATRGQFEIHFGPIACVRQVIDLEGFFALNISENERKAIALEMESYGVVRACELSNEGRTIPLIIKAAMDNTVDKIDDAKTLAAWRSAVFVKFILEQDWI